MRSNSWMGNTRMKFVAGAVLLCLASAAGASSLVGGGATLPAIGYTGSATFPAAFTPITPGAGSLLGVYASTSSNSVTYCPTGSGAGKKILAGNTPATFQVNGRCGETSTTAPLGFTLGGTSLAQASFAASDAPISASEFAAYTAGHGTGTQPVQFPSVAGAIAVVFNKAGVTSLTLTEAQICGVFSGKITNWSDLVAGATGTIKVVYRSDGSGTSFSMLNHLSAVCPANVFAGTTAADQFTTSQNWAGGLDSTGRPVGAQAYINSSFVPANGNAGVTSTVTSTADSIGYAEAANGITAPARFASVRNAHSNVVVSPATGFGLTTFSVPSTALVYDQSIADTTTSTGRPILNALSTTSQCIAVVNPDAYADPSTGYPIVAVTYLLANGQGNGSDASAVSGLLFSPYNKTTRSSVTKIGRINTGYAWLANATLDDSTGIQTKIDACVGL
jgi:phosphate transport system substrate-binding protein